MEAKLSTCFLNGGWYGGGIKFNQVNVRFYPLPSHRLLPASCKMRQRNFSPHNKRQQPKKINLNHPENANIQLNDNECSDPGIFSKDGNSDSIEEPEPISDDSIPITREAEHLNEEDTRNSSAPNVVDSGAEAKTSLNEITHSSANIVGKSEGGEQISGLHLEDLIGMIRNAEKNIHLLNHARIRARDDLEKILCEKEDLQGEINSLETKLAETDARLRVAAQEKIHVELLEDQLEKLRNELSSRNSSEGLMYNLNDSFPFSQSNDLNSYSEGLDVWRTENNSLKDELQALKTELSNLKETDERVQTLEKERLSLQSSLKELEFKLSVSQEDVSKISSLKSECKSLYDKVEHLQHLLENATKQADQAILALQQNQELRKKVDRLEESLEEANVYKLSSEKMQKYNELMQQKIQILDERLLRSDEEIDSYVQLYQNSMNEFQDTLNILKEESKKRAHDETVDDMPLEFWSRLLLMIDGWFLEKKILAEDAMLLREMVWKRDVNIHDAYMSCKEKTERETIATFLRLTSSTSRPRLHVIHIAAEMAPVAKVGGLGDVVAGLSKALQKKGHLVEIVLPKYDCMNYELVQDLKVLDVPVESYFDGRLYKNKIWTGTVEGLPVYFIEPQHPGNFFWRGQFYGEPDDFKRFSFFSRAALELLLQAGKKADIIHCHDWQTAFVAPLYWDLYVPKGLNSARICFTCHNFEYQGTAPATELASCGLDVYNLNRPDRMQDNSAHDRINPIKVQFAKLYKFSIAPTTDLGKCLIPAPPNTLHSAPVDKGAIVFSNIVTTVSPTYAQEVRSAEGGRGLHETLNSHSKKFVGILNGIDTDAWNPATDKFLKVQYNANDIEGKEENKEDLRRRLGLSSDDVRRPLVGCITRLVPQKGVHLIRHAIYRTLELGGQFILLGSSPVPHIQREFEDIANYFQSHEHARLILKYDESLSHLIYAATDMLIIPSIFEPCGLTQMIAMRYGSIPIARKTGGLNDSVFDVDDDTIPIQYRNGFTFLTADEQGFNNALERAFNVYKNNIDGWKQLVQKDMGIDFSWDSSASLYEELYAKAAARARAANRA